MIAIAEQEKIKTTTMQIKRESRVNESKKQRAEDLNLEKASLYV